MTLTYDPTYPGGWRDKPDTSTPIDAAALDHLEAGISAAVAALAGLPLIYVPRFASAPDHTIYPAYIDTSTVPPAVKGWNGSAFVAIGGASITDNGDGTATF